jgi:hypothetical protein
VVVGLQRRSPRASDTRCPSRIGSEQSSLASHRKRGAKVGATVLAPKPLTRDLSVGCRSRKRSRCHLLLRGTVERPSSRAWLRTRETGSEVEQGLDDRGRARGSFRLQKSIRGVWPDVSHR